MRPAPGTLAFGSARLPLCFGLSLDESTKRARCPSVMYAHNAQRRRETFCLPTEPTDTAEIHKSRLGCWRPTWASLLTAYSYSCTLYCRTTVFCLQAVPSAESTSLECTVQEHTHTLYCSTPLRWVVGCVLAFVGFGSVITIITSATRPYVHFCRPLSRGAGGDLR